MERTEVNETNEDQNFREIKTIYIEDSSRTNYQSTPYGFDSVPLKGADAIRSSTGRTNVVVGYVQKKVDGLAPGESVMFSRDSDGKLKTTVIARGNGSVELLGDSDNLVRHSNLKEEFDKLNDAYNDLINRLLAWVPAFGDGGAALKTALTTPTPISQSRSIIDNAKHEGLKTNSK